MHTRGDTQDARAGTQCILCVCLARASFLPPFPRAVGRCLSHAHIQVHARTFRVYFFRLLLGSLTNASLMLEGTVGRRLPGACSAAHFLAAVMECVCDQRIAAAERWAGQRRRRSCVCFRGSVCESACVIRGLRLLRGGLASVDAVRVFVFADQCARASICARQGAGWAFLSCTV
jgi:hypothetical protein